MIAISLTFSRAKKRCSTNSARRGSSLASGDGTFTWAAQAHDDVYNVWNFAAARFDNDTIFANDFD